MTANPNRALSWAFLALASFSVSLTLTGSSNAIVAATAAELTSATVPLHLEFNRPFIDLEFSRPDGTIRKARFWVDTGGGGFIFVEPLARELGMKFGSEFSESGERMCPSSAPVVTLGGMPLDTRDARVFISLGRTTMSPGVSAEGLFPAHMLRRYHVIFDYPARKFTLAKPGSLKSRGTRIDAPIHSASGFPRITVRIGGEPFGFLLDTGASFTMISRAQIEKWSSQHADWPVVTGAAGRANMGLGAVETTGLMIRLPELELGNFRLNGIGAVSRPPGTFEKYMSRMMTEPIIGAMGGNVLRAFRVEIDYAAGAVYLDKRGDPDSEVEFIPVTLNPSADGTYRIGGVIKKDGKSLVDWVEPGDKLITIDSFDVSGKSLAEVVERLHGKAGSKHKLVIERGGKQKAIEAAVIRLL